MSKEFVHWKKQFDYEYLGAYSLADSDDENTTYTPVNVTFKKTGRKIVKNERGQEDCFVCWFEEKVGGETKPMILNKTNCAIVEELHTANINDWIGKSVQLWVDLRVKAQGGEITKGLRFRSAATPIPKRKPKTKPAMTPNSKGWAKAKVSVQAGTIDLEGMRKHYTITEANFKLLQKAD